MRIKAIGAFYDNYIWAIIDDNERAVICVDPGECAPVIRFLEELGLNLKAILLTHHHADHIGGVAGLLQSYPETLVYGPVDARIALIQYPVKEGDCIGFGSLGFPLQFMVMETPGHTNTHICYFEPTQQWLFCGDTLFSAGCGRVFDGTMEALYDSLQRLKQLPDATKVFCAHEYTQQNLRFASMIEPANAMVKNELLKLKAKPMQCTLPSTIAREKQINPFFRTDNAQTGLAVASEALGQKLTEFEVFAAIRAKKNHFS